MQPTSRYKVRRVEDLVILVCKIDRRSEICSSYHESVDLLDSLLHHKVVALSRWCIFCWEALRDMFGPVGGNPALDTSLELCTQLWVCLLVLLHEIVPLGYPLIASGWDISVSQPYALFISATFSVPSGAPCEAACPAFALPTPMILRTLMNSGFVRFGSLPFSMAATIDSTSLMPSSTSMMSQPHAAIFLLTSSVLVRSTLPSQVIWLLS